MRTISRSAAREICWTLVLLAFGWLIGTCLASIAHAQCFNGGCTQPPSIREDASDDVPSVAKIVVLSSDNCPWCDKLESEVVPALRAEGVVVSVVKNRAYAAECGVTSFPTAFALDENRAVIAKVVGYCPTAKFKEKVWGRGYSSKTVTRRPGGSLGVDVRVRKPGVSVDVHREKQPRPACRYERPAGHRAAVVRIYCSDTVKTRSIGSGTLVRWAGKKILVLTARHVIQDAKSIVVELFTKKTHKARVLKVDAVWDCAVLELVGEPEGVAPAEIEMGDAAMQSPGNRLESCGFGPDNQFAVNSGLFIGYKRSTQAPNGPDDWFEISGHARQGDSGGPIFNEHGRLVGVLWGTDGQVVVGVQAGRIHVLLDGAIGQTTQRAYFVPSGGEAIDPNKITKLQFERHPTPPKPAMNLGDLPEAACDCGPNGCPLPGPDFSDTNARSPGKKALPWRGKAEGRDQSQEQRIDSLLQAIQAERQARLDNQQQPALPPLPPANGPVVVETKDRASPLLAGLCCIAAVVAGGVIFFATQKGA
jgi:S1-C subfamily serine protease